MFIAWNRVHHLILLMRDFCFSILIVHSPRCARFEKRSDRVVVYWQWMLMIVIFCAFLKIKVSVNFSPKLLAVKSGAVEIE
jgi:hypothetical protein